MRRINAHNAPREPLVIHLTLTRHRKESVMFAIALSLQSSLSARR